MSKFTNAERQIVRSIVASLSIKKVPEVDIMKQIEQQTNKRITRKTLYNIRKQIKRESFKWFQMLKQGQWDYIHEYRERINEIVDLQKRHYEIVDSPDEPTAVKQSSLVELHKLSISLSNLIEVAPSIGNAVTLPATPETKPTTEQRKFIV